MSIPSISTKRLLLRGFESRDAEPYMSMMEAADVISLIRPANVGSIRVATSLGATPDGSVEFFGAPALIYRDPRTAP